MLDKAGQLDAEEWKAERPYRGAVPIPKTLKMMAKTVGVAIGADCFNALKKAMAQLPA